MYILSSALHSWIINEPHLPEPHLPEPHLPEPHLPEQWLHKVNYRTCFRPLQCRPHQLHWGDRKIWGPLHISWLKTMTTKHNISLAYMKEFKETTYMPYNSRHGLTKMCLVKFPGIRYYNVHTYNYSSRYLTFTSLCKHCEEEYLYLLLSCRSCMVVRSLHQTEFCLLSEYGVTMQ